MVPIMEISQRIMLQLTKHISIMYLWYMFYLHTHNDTNPSIMLASLHDNERHPLETVPTTEQKNI